MTDEEISKDVQDPIKLHREGTALSDTGKYKEATEKFMSAYELYKKSKNFFDASYALFKAAECNYLTKDYGNAEKRFLEAADLALEVGYDRFGISALEYAVDCYRASGKNEKIKKLQQKIEQLKEQLSNV